MQTNFKRPNQEKNDYVEATIRMNFGGSQLLTAVGKVFWSELKYQDDGTESFRFGLSCASGVSVKGDSKTEYPYGTHWFTVLSSPASQEAKSKTDANPDRPGTNAERLAETVIPGTYMGVVYHPQVNIDGSPRVTIRKIEKNEGPKKIEEEVAETSWGTYGGSAIVEIFTLGTKEEREQQAAAYESGKANRASGGSAPAANSAPAATQGRGTAWRGASTGGTTTTEPAPVQLPAPAAPKPLWGQKKA